ncbi:MAG: EcsC family protein [Candidatus Dadabacteria bacterium]
MSYEDLAYIELQDWKRKMSKQPSIFNRLSKRVQTKINSYIPEKVHKTITTVLKEMIRAVLFGAKYTTSAPAVMRSLLHTEQEVLKVIEKYKKTGAAEGGLTGAGGFLWGFADFPLLIGIKIKMLFDIASLYGCDVKDYKERVYILHIFELAFSSQQHRVDVFQKIKDWETIKHQLPGDIHSFDWRSFQQEYRDYIDLAKMAQMIPGIGAVVGLIANYKLIAQLGKTAMNAYRMRLYHPGHLQKLPLIKY